MIVFAHRGASAYELGNTIASIKKAVELGAKAIEFDIQMTKDRKIILHHDFQIKTSDQAIRDMYFHDLSTLIEKNYPIATLEDVLTIIPENVFINIEIKSYSMYRQKLEKELLVILKSYKRLENTLISSFDHKCILDLYELNNDLKLGLLFYIYPVNVKKYIENCGLVPYSVNLSIELVDKELVEEVQQCGSKVFVYTVNERGMAVTLKNMGVDGIFSDYPKLLEK